MAGDAGGAGTRARFAPMNELRLRFCDGEQADLVLETGLHALGRLPTGLGPVDAGQPWLLQLCNDRRGIWMTVADGLGGVHVNGRSIQHVAMLRAGDSIHVDGDELLLTSRAEPGQDLPANSAVRDPVAVGERLLLRGIGGQHHGHGINLEKPRRIGRGSQMDIRIDGQSISEQHAIIEVGNGQAVLRDAQADVLVNGHVTRHTNLQVGDQITFAAQHRFVLEGTPPQVASNQHSFLTPGSRDDLEMVQPARRSWLGRMPWLLIAAILLAAALSSLLLFGAR